MTSKDELRRQVRQAKRAVAFDEKVRRSAAIMNKLEQLDLFCKAKTVLLYWSMADEVHTHPTVERYCKEKTILLPCVDGDDLLLRQYTGPECMHAGEQFGIAEPTGPIYRDLDAIDVIVVPGVAFDSKGNRMGRGRGFYDRLLSTVKAYKIGVAFNFQMFDSIPVDDHDIPMDLVLSER